MRSQQRLRHSHGVVTPSRFSCVLCKYLHSQNTPLRLCMLPQVICPQILFAKLTCPIQVSISADALPELSEQILALCRNRNISSILDQTEEIPLCLC